MTEVAVNYMIKTIFSFCALILISCILLRLEKKARLQGRWEAICETKACPPNDVKTAKWDGETSCICTLKAK